MQELKFERNGATARMTNDAVRFVSPEAELPFRLLSLDEEKTDHACYCYLNVGTCPDCGGGMVRLGSCFSCPLCGYQNCG